MTDEALVSLRARAERAKKSSVDGLEWQLNVDADELLALLDRLEAAERERDRLTAKYEPPGFVSTAAKVIEERTRAEAAEARLLAAQQALREIEHESWAWLEGEAPALYAAIKRGAALAAVGRDPQHVHHWVDKATLHEPSLKVCECGATMTESEYHDAVGRDPQ